MKKFITSTLIALATITAMAQTQDRTFLMVRGTQDLRAGYSIPLKTLDPRINLTLNAWTLVSVKDASLNGLSFNDFNHGYLGFGLQAPVYKADNITIGLAAGWSGDFTRVTQRISNGEWSIGAFVTGKF